MRHIASPFQERTTAAASRPILRASVNGQRGGVFGRICKTEGWECRLICIPVALLFIAALALALLFELLGFKSRNELGRNAVGSDERVNLKGQHGEVIDHERA